MKPSRSLGNVYRMSKLVWSRPPSRVASGRCRRHRRRCCWLVGWLVETCRRCVTTSDVAALAAAVASPSHLSRMHAAAVVAVDADRRRALPCARCFRPHPVLVAVDSCHVAVRRCRRRRSDAGDVRSPQSTPIGLVGCVGWLCWLVCWLFCHFWWLCWVALGLLLVLWFRF